MNKDLEKKILEVADLIYNTGYTAGSAENGFDDGYKYGLKAAWEAARKLIEDASNNYDMIDEMFGDCSVDFIIINNSIEDVLFKIKTYENKGTCDKCIHCIHNNKGTCNKCVHTKCNTCVHKHEDNICCGCNNDSEYENEYTEKKEPDLTETKPEQSCDNCTYEDTCSSKCPEHVKANGCRGWKPKQHNSIKVVLHVQKNMKDAMLLTVCSTIYLIGHQSRLRIKSNLVMRLFMQQAAKE